MSYLAIGFSILVVGWILVELFRRKAKVLTLTIKKDSFQITSRITGKVLFAPPTTNKKLGEKFVKTLKEVFFISSDKVYISYSQYKFIKTLYVFEALKEKQLKFFEEGL